MGRNPRDSVAQSHMQPYTPLDSKGRSKRNTLKGTPTPKRRALNDVAEMSGPYGPDRRNPRPTDSPRRNCKNPAAYAGDTTPNDLDAELAILRTEHQILMNRLKQRETRALLEERLGPEAETILTRTKYQDDSSDDREVEPTPSPGRCEVAPVANPYQEEDRKPRIIGYLIEAPIQPGTHFETNPSADRQILEAITNFHEQYQPITAIDPTRYIIPQPHRRRSD